MVRELEDLGRLWLGGMTAPPCLPTLRAEKHLGFDAELLTVRLALFVQFKLGDYVSRRHPGSPTWSSVRRDHYRTAVHSDDAQLRALLDLETGGVPRSRPIIVSYIAPAFCKRADFDHYYASNEVLRHSYYFRPSDVPLDGDQHYRVMTADRAISLMLSEPTQIPDRFSPDAIDPQLTEILRDPELSFSLVALEQQVQGVCIRAGLASDVDLNDSETQGVLDQLYIWCHRLGVLPIIWAETPTDQSV